MGRRDRIEYVLPIPNLNSNLYRLGPHVLQYLTRWQQGATSAEDKEVLLSKIDAIREESESLRPLSIRVPSNVSLSHLRKDARATRKALQRTDLSESEKTVLTGHVYWLQHE